MSPPKKPQEVTLEFVRVREEEDFSYERQEYTVLHTFGDAKKVCFPWDAPMLQEGLAELEKSHPDGLKLERLGHYLRDFLETSNWARDEGQLDQARMNRSPIHLTIRSNAPEMYYLPWELLPLKPSGTQLGQMPDCLIRYELRGILGQEPGLTPSRILLAGSGNVDFERHRNAIMAACQGVPASRRPALEVLANLTRQSLTRALSDASRSITVLHLLCHGTLISENVYGLELHPPSEYGKPDRLHAAELRGIIAGCTNLPRLVVLSVCLSGDVGRPAHRLGSVAQTLHLQGVPAVLASRMPLSTEGSVQMTEVLYNELIGGSGNLRKAVSAARRKLHELKSKDWVSLQLYARELEPLALEPFRRPEPPDTGTSPRGDLVLICHAAYGAVHGAPEPVDAPELFAHRPRIRKVSIDQTAKLKERQWANLEKEVKRLTSRKGQLLRTLEEHGTELVYYGFPFVPLAALVGFLAQTRHVHLFEHDRTLKRFTWVREAEGPFPPLRVEARQGSSGSAARLRLSISATVDLDDCRAVLPEEEVRLDVHCRLDEPQRGIVRREDQAQEYARQLCLALDQHIAKNSSIQQIHVFAAVPVSIAFHLGQALTASWLKSCCVYNHGAEDVPRYKWRLWLQAAKKGLPAVEIL
ncbi:SAVED domain-containing protein [Vitiosangium sp. GDMCC 1.1324]|uniref:SAVED domain-containing protein n=1 Tax=Vitiosangium sp. (strain GDMCC 1.1324) TaxID=2138576 RepID=UPI000D3ACB7C|nr:SAVED domain-containing protein [Vitiosangium sp. GDMCC 1.1324]PTL78195.1 hypothetical protein DAT35_39745 [Vitiosangium sp. GDMCC 1.1324]